MEKIKNFFSKIKNAIAEFLYKFKFGYIMIITGIVVSFWDLFLKFMLDGKRMPGLKNIFSIYSAHNTGGAWSIFSNATWLLIVVSSVVLVGLLVFQILLKKDKKSYVYSIGMGLLIGGAICNLADRIRLGYVRDFIKLEFINFPIFNLADMAITAGVIMICIHFIILLPRKEKMLKAKAEAKVLNNQAIDNKEENKIVSNEPAISNDKTESKLEKNNIKNKKDSVKTKKVKKITEKNTGDVNE